MDDNISVGLFGTCGKSTWRQYFIENYKKQNINCFNPQREDWSSECAKEEAYHLAHDRIILFPITHESYGLGSLGEVGFSILNAIKLNNRRNFIILIDDYIDKSEGNKELRQQSFISRALILEHLKKLRLDNVYLVKTMKQMYETSVCLYKIRTN